MEEKLLGHLLKANDAETTREVEQLLADDPSAIHDLTNLRRAFGPLESMRDEVDPPSGLWVRAIGRVAEHMVATEGFKAGANSSRTEQIIRRAAALANPTTGTASIRPAPPASDLADSSPRRRNILGIVGLSASVLALALPVIANIRQTSNRTVCQNSMRQFYAAASDYSDTNDGQFPRVEDGKPAASAAEVLRISGYLPPDQRIFCPATQTTSDPAGFVDYAYSLGFRNRQGELKGLDRRAEYNSLPILADAPLRDGTTAKPCNHRHGQNVLFAGGHVHFYTTTRIGDKDDDIFCNAKGHVGAGLFPKDAALGRPEEQP